MTAGKQTKDRKTEIKIHTSAFLPFLRSLIIRSEDEAIVTARGDFFTGDLEIGG